MNQPSQRGTTALHLAIRQNDKRIAQLLLENQVDINPRDEDGLTPLDLAIDLGSADAVQLLPTYGAPT